MTIIDSLPINIQFAFNRTFDRAVVRACHSLPAVLLFFVGRFEIEICYGQKQF